MKNKKLRTMIISSDVTECLMFERLGVERIFMDREVSGKVKRQKTRNTHIAVHSYKEITAVAKALTKAELMVRVNPLNDRSKQEVRSVLESGAERVMLPMFKGLKDVIAFRDIVGADTPITWLVETPEALISSKLWIKELDPFVDQVHIGLNDLSLGFGLNNMFELLPIRCIDGIINELQLADITYGVGGVGSSSSNLHISSRLLISEYARLESEWVILSRAFKEAQGVESIRLEEYFHTELQYIDNAYNSFANCDASQNIINLTNMHEILGSRFTNDD